MTADTTTCLATIDRWACVLDEVGPLYVFGKLAKSEQETANHPNGGKSINWSHAPRYDGGPTDA